MKIIFPSWGLKTGCNGMSNGGLSRKRLDNMHNVMAGYVKRGEVPGILTLVSRKGEIHVDALGTTSINGNKPIKRDTIFRISSMTKPITAAAAMILVEECKLRLDEPVDRLLPELSWRQVLTRLDAPLGDTVPAKRPITLRDLLTLRMGIGLIIWPQANYPKCCERNCGRGTACAASRSHRSCRS